MTSPLFLASSLILRAFTPSASLWSGLCHHFQDEIWSHVLQHVCAASGLYLAVNAFGHCPVTHQPHDGPLFCWPCAGAKFQLPIEAVSFRFLSPFFALAWLGKAEGWTVFCVMVLAYGKGEHPPAQVFLALPRKTTPLFLCPF